MYRYSKNITLLLIVAILSQPVFSQLRRGYSRNPFDLAAGLTITPKAGVNLFFGDLVDESRTSYTVGLTVEREMTRSVGMRASLLGGKMKGDQVYPITNTTYASFKNFYAELGFGATYFPLNHLMGYFRERTFQPYGLAQFGVIYFSATETWGPASAGTRGAVPGEVWREPSGVTPFVGAGAGVSLWLSPMLSANLEFTGNLPFSDQLDGHDVWYDSWEPRGIEHTTDPFDFYYTVTMGVKINIADSQFRNDSRYNRASYQKTRKFLLPKSRSRSPQRRR